MKSILFYLLLMVSAVATAQTTTHNITTGASYANSQFYKLSTDATQSVAHTGWDIAFSVYGSTDAGIFVNEGSTLSGTPAALYEVPNKVFSDVITSSDYGNELKNPEIDWANGAFNVPKVATNSGDYGWGTYTGPPAYAVAGTKVYVVETATLTKKIVIDSMVSGTYYFRYADLNGANLQSKSIAKSSHSGKTLAHFSLTAGNTVTAEPTTGWDWVLTRYNTLLYSTTPPTPYNVGGILTNRGVQVAMADGINPSTVTAGSYTRTADSLKIIGHDWKSFGFTSGWSTDADRVYFVQSTDNNLYKIYFIDFQGSSTGQGTFQKTFLGTVTPVQKISENSSLNTMDVYPNPASDVVNVTYSLEEAKADVQLLVYDILGNVVLQQQVNGNKGLNALVLNGWDWASGQYIVTIKTDDAIATQKLIIQK